MTLAELISKNEKKRSIQVLAVDFGRQTYSADVLAAYDFIVKHIDIRFNKNAYPFNRAVSVIINSVMKSKVSEPYEDWAVAIDNFATSAEVALANSCEHWLKYIDIEQLQTLVLNMRLVV